MEKKFKRTLVTSALPYANGPVHIGHLAGVYVPADIYVRYLRLKGEEVLFIGGSDEHGVPVTIRAKKEGITIKVKVPESWHEPIYVWIWGDDVQEGDYEHLAKKQGDWYMFTRYTKQLNIIFKTGKGWTGNANQSEDLKTDRSGCYILTQEADEKAKFTEVDCD